MVDGGWTTGTEGDFATLPLCHFAALRGVLLQPQAPSLLLGLRAPHTHRHTQALRAASLAPRVFIVSAARACAACPLVSSLPESSSLRPSSSAWCLGLRVSERGTRVCVGACRWRVGLRTFRGRRAFVGASSSTTTPLCVRCVLVVSAPSLPLLCSCTAASHRVSCFLSPSLLALAAAVLVRTRAPSSTATSCATSCATAEASRWLTTMATSGWCT